MKQVLQHVRSGLLELAEVPEPALKEGGVLVANVCSLISAGTEKMIIDFAEKSLIGKARERPDLVRQVLEKVRREGIAPTLQAVLSRLDQSIPLGYSCAGIVERVSSNAQDFAPGDRVACAGMGYASHANVVFVPKNLVVQIPEGVSFEDAAYVTLGAIALQGIRTIEPKIGDIVAVIGLGLLGQLSVQILKANGCRVLGIDLDPQKVILARDLGADLAVTRSDNVQAAVDEITGGRGVDAVLIAAATESNDPVELAGSILRDRGCVSIVGAVKMEIPRKIYYEKELQLRLSRSYGPGRYDPLYEEQGTDYPIGYVRWTEKRNMEEFLRLVSIGSVTPSRLTSNRFPIHQAQAAYELLTGKAGKPFAGVLLEYDQVPEERKKRIEFANVRTTSRSPGIGFVGAGNFARAILLPRFQRAKYATLIGLATASGASAKSAGEKFGFRYATTDTAQLFGDKEIQAVVIATRHGSHSRLVAQALRAGKSVFVEKPMAIDEAGLQEILAAHHESGALLAVGFNRRFSGLAWKLRSAFEGAGSIAINYRVNAGPIPPNSWLYDPVEGGGRIIGEVCHFLDFVQFLTNDLPHRVFAVGLTGQPGRLHDTLTISLGLSRGSIANISYFATGDRSFPKERVEVFGGGAIGVLDDFRDLTTAADGKKKRIRVRAQDKGYDQEITAFLDAVRTGGGAPIAMESLVATTRATFAIEESLRTGRPVIV